MNAVTIIQTKLDDHQSKKWFYSLMDTYEKPVDDIKNDDVFLAMTNEKAIGCVALYKNELRRLFVVPEYRQNGIGKQLVVSVIELARKKGVTQLELRTRASMTPAIQLYTQLGFIAQSTPIANFQFVMRKDL